MPAPTPTPPAWAAIPDVTSQREASVAVGVMNFGKRTSEPDAHRIVARAIERGAVLFDTANAYNDGESERILGRALKGRAEVAIATKVGFGKVFGRPEGLSAKRVFAAADESLARLGVGQIDVFYLHVPDPSTEIEETLEAMHQLIEVGKVAHFGVSNYASWQIVEMIRLCDRASMPRPIIGQQIYNALIRQLDIEYFAFARRYRLHTTVYNPLAGGMLTERYRQVPSTANRDRIPSGSRFDNNALYQGRYWSESMLSLTARLGQLAEQNGRTLVDLAYGFLASKVGVDSILIGPGSVEHLDAAFDACARPLEPELHSAVDEAHRHYLGTRTTYAR